MLKDGEIVERGVHEELVKRGGVYTELYETQFRQALDAVREAGTGYPEVYGPSDVY